MNMDIGNVRPALTGITVPVPRAPAQGNQSVSTDLPARAAVTEARKAESNSVGSSTSQSGKNASSTANPVVDSRIEIDQSTRTVIFQKIDQGTGDVISQVPEESMLRMHAAMQSQVQAHEQASAAQMSQVDRSV
jgi:uncharacterized FlaG/YvyC family protein